MIKGEIREFRANTFNIFEIIIQIGMFERPGCRNGIHGPKIIKFDGADVSRRPKSDCNHDYDFQYFFFTEVSHGASRIISFFWSILRNNCSKSMKLEINSKRVANTCIMWRF